MSWKKPRIVHEQRILLYALLSGIPAIIVAMVFTWTSGYTPKVEWTLTLLVAAFWLGFGLAVRERVASPLRTLANLLEAMREGDYSIRARGGRSHDAMGEVIQQVNAMSATLRAQRLGALEATTLLRKVMEEIDVAVFAFDSAQRLRLVNRAATRLMAEPAERLIARDAASLGLDTFLVGEPESTVQRAFPGATARWGVSRSNFRESGLPHQLLVLTDLTRPLREEELQAWQRLVRVLGHELNNSLAPIKSIAGSLESLLQREPRPHDWEDDMRRGLGVIASRSESLSRFMTAYARLARLPQPTLARVRVGELVRRVAGFETRIQPELSPGPELSISGDADQLEQVLINLVKNATEASLETHGRVQVGWGRSGMNVEILIRDEGPGISNTSNLFVPFFTTKPGGSGIGLVLSRQIAEAHGGTLTLKNREDRRGSEARLLLPL